MNIQFSTNLWCTYYDDDTEDKGFYIDEIYVGSDPQRVNLADWFSDSAMAYVEKHIMEDIEIRRAWA